MDGFWIGVGLFLGLYYLGEHLSEGLNRLGSHAQSGLGNLGRAMRYDAKMRGGFVRKKEPPAAPPDPRMEPIRKWLSSPAAADLSAEEAVDAMGCWEVVSGIREANAARYRDCQSRLVNYGAPSSLMQVGLGD